MTTDLNTKNTGVFRTPVIAAFCDLSASAQCIPVWVWLIMSLSVESIAKHAAVVSKLTQQMNELRALRRALCLQMAMRSHPKGARRSADRSSRRGRHSPQRRDQAGREAARAWASVGRTAPAVVSE
jgi:hypothetical protein